MRNAHLPLDFMPFWRGLCEISTGDFKTSFCLFHVVTLSPSQRITDVRRWWWGRERSMDTARLKLSHSTVHMRGMFCRPRSFYTGLLLYYFLLPFYENLRKLPSTQLCQHLRQSSYQAVCMATGAVQTPEKVVLSHSAML